MTAARFRTIRFVAALACAAALVLCASDRRPASAQAKKPPRLIVIVVVDQMRADYLEWYRKNYTSGFDRLLREGAVYTDAAYPYLNTITCAGHSTIGTGTFPYRHGMIMNNWFDRQTGKTPYCTDDPTMTEISYNGLASVQGDSAKLLLTPAIGEQVMKRGGRSVAMSLKPRSAVTLTGRQATSVVWFDDRGGWTTSTAFTNEPVSYLQSFIDANPLTSYMDKVWEKSLPPSAYQGEDDVKSEGTIAGWTRTFPHPIGVPGGKADSQYYGRWQRSPFADEYLARMAMASVDALKLGQGETTDFLGVSFSVVDGVGHLFGPRSHEIQDVLARLDRTLGMLLDHLDASVGKGNYVLGLSADHGVAEIPDTVGGGRVAGKSVSQALESVLVPALGPGPHVAATVYTNVYLAEPARARLSNDAELREAALNAVRGVQGIKYALWGPDLATAAARRSSDPVRRAAALSHHPDRSGDIVVAPMEKWILSTAVTTHGTLYSYDQRVPLILFGAGVKTGHYSGAATPADLMPSLSALARVKIASTDGRALNGAVR